MKRFTSAFLLLLLTSCGVPLEAEPEILDITIDDPPQVAEPPTRDLEAVTLYLVGGETVVPVTRDLTSPADVEVILESLFEGVTEPESRAGLRTSVPPETRLLGVERDGSSVVVDLGREFTAVGGEQEVMAVAQIVLTAPAVEGVESVSFEIESIPTAVPVSDGALSSDAVTAHQYGELLQAPP